jgi:hypothetical protein
VHRVLGELLLPNRLPQLGLEGIDADLSVFHFGNLLIPLIILASSNPSLCANVPGKPNKILPLLIFSISHSARRICSDVPQKELSGVLASSA